MSFSQNLSDDGYGQSNNNSQVLIEVAEPQNHNIGNKKYTDYLVKTKVIKINKKKKFILLFYLKRPHCQFLS